MSFQPRLSLPRNTACIFPDVHSFFDAILGPTGADAHVKAWHQYQWIKRQNADLAAGDAALRAAVADMNARARAEWEARR